MNLNLSGRHLEITPAIREYVAGKLRRVTRHFDDVTSAAVVLSVEKLRQKAECTLHVRGRDIFAESDDQNLYAAIDALADKLDRSLTKHKGKVRSHDGTEKSRGVE